jgi:hypothetical protein
MIIIIAMSVHHTMNSLNTFATSKYHLNFIKDTSDIDNENGRIFYAQFLFEQYGIKIPYRLDSGEFVIFQPTEDLIEKYKKRLDQQKAKIEIEKNLSRTAYSSFKLAIAQAVVFFFSFVTTVTPCVRVVVAQVGWEHSGFFRSEPNSWRRRESDRRTLW